MSWEEVNIGLGKKTIIDSEDFALVTSFKWYVSSRGYVNRHPRMINGVRHGKIMLHRLINKTPPGMITDHINGNKLDNRKCNLRTVTPTQNSWNTKFLGVSFHKRDKKWVARVQNNGKRVNLGYFDEREDAIREREIYIRNTRGSYGKI